MRIIQTSVDEVSNFWWIKTPQNSHCKFSVSVFRLPLKRNHLKSNSFHVSPFEMPGPRNNHFEPHFKRDGKPPKPATVCPPQDVRKQLNAVYDFAKQHHHLNLLLKVTKAGIELTRIRLAEKLDSFRKESIFRKRWRSLKEKTSNSTQIEFIWIIDLNKNCSRFSNRRVLFWWCCFFALLLGIYFICKVSSDSAAIHMWKYEAFECWALPSGGEKINKRKSPPLCIRELSAFFMRN